MWPGEDFGGSAKGRVDRKAERKTRPFQEYECGIHEGRRRQGLRWETWAWKQMWEGDKGQG